ncbi:MAG: hypothetical protein KIS87_09150 [Phycisphaeraceae bacterium]|nr:hypothetical protein [Phycisphaeraceae bacterium]
MGGTMSAHERARQDVEAGDYGMARLRLGSYLSSVGYDPATVSMLARICWDMGDPAEAGRFWLLSEDVGPDVDAAIEAFVRRAGASPAQLLSALPHWARAQKIGDYPTSVAARLRGLGIEGLQIATISRVPARLRGVAPWIVFWAIVGPLIAFCAIGFIQTIRWLYSIVP